MKLAWLEPQSYFPTLDVEHLRRNGVTCDRLDVAHGHYQTSLDSLAHKRGYVEQDIVELSPDTEGFQAICDKFASEHLHTDDEVRFVLSGEGIFDIRDESDRWMRAIVEAGDLIVIPQDRYHRFTLTDAKQIRCVRLFKDRGGWVPHYR